MRYTAPFDARLPFAASPPSLSPDAAAPTSMIEIEVISVDTEGTGSDFGGSGAGDPTARVLGRPSAADRGRVDDALGVDAQRVDLLEPRVEQHEPLALAVDAEHAAGRLGAGEQVAGLVEASATTWVDRVL